MVEESLKHLGYYTCPGGGIGRRVGLKHQCLRACRFDSGPGYFDKAPSYLEGAFFCFFIAGGEVYPDEAKWTSGTPALGTENPFRSNFEGVFEFFGKL